MSTPKGRPFPPAEIIDYVPRRVRERMYEGGWEEETMRQAAGSGDPRRTPRDEPEKRLPHHDEEPQSTPLAPRGPHEEPGHEAHERDRRASEDEFDEAPVETFGEEFGNAIDDRLGKEIEARLAAELALPAEESEYDRGEAERPEVDRTKSEEQFDESLDRLADLLRSIRSQKDMGETDDETSAASHLSPPVGLRYQSFDRTRGIGGLRGPPSLQPLSVPPPPGREHGARPWGAVVAAITVAGLLAWWFATGQPLELARGPDRASEQTPYSVAPSLTADTPRGIDTAGARGARLSTAQYTVAAASTEQAAPVASGEAAQAQALLRAQMPRTVPLTRIVPGAQEQQGGGSSSAAAATAQPPAQSSSTAVANLQPTPRAAAPAAAYFPPVAVQVPSATRPVARAVPTMDREETTLLLKQGEQFIASGDLATARTVLRRVAEAGVAEGALALGRTFDPAVLAKMGVRGVAADAEQARRWYEKARELGSAEAAHRLEMMAAQ